MADFKKLIDNKAESAQYMIDEITHICKDLPKRGPGDEGEKLACEYMADVLKNDCGCERADVESFKENPHSFLGWIYFTVSFALAGMVLFFFIPALGAALIAIGFLIMIVQFGMYRKLIDFVFPEKTGHNVTAIKKCKGEVKARIFFNGHPDAAWNWPVNNRFGGAVYEAHIGSSVAGAIISLVLCIVAAVVTEGKMMTDISLDAYIATYGEALFWCGIADLIFVPGLILMYFMWDPKTTVDGANDNLTGCYMGIAILKAMKDAGIELEHTEVGVILSGSEEAGLRGAKAWVEQHQGEFDDVPTWIYSYDTIHASKFLGVNYRDLNGTVKADKEVSDTFMESAKELGIHCNKTWVPPLGGATDSAAFAQGGYKVTGITALNHVLEDYYHTLKDTYTNLDKDCLADCYAISVKCLQKFDEKFGK